jgi:hypothetical protein
MPRVLRIKIEEGRSIAETADWLAMSTSAVLDKLFPAQSGEGMKLMVRRIDQMLAARDDLLDPLVSMTATSNSSLHTDPEPT